MSLKLYYITIERGASRRPSFETSFMTENDIVVHSAPMIAYLRGQRLSRVEKICKERGWKLRQEGEVNGLRPLSDRDSGRPRNINAR